MERLWWRMPGPARYVNQIIQEIRDGKNVILCLPEYFPRGLAGAVRHALGESDGWSWKTLNVFDENIVQPSQFLFQCFVPNSDPRSIWDADTLLKEGSFSNYIIWVDAITGKEWTAWKEFITEYEHACRSVESQRRSLFCIPLVGELAVDLPPEDVCLSHHFWRGFADFYDTLLYSSYIFRERQMPRLQNRIAVSIVTNLALWDPYVVERFANESFEKILNPKPILDEIACKRGWTDRGAANSGFSWYNGAVNTYEGEEKKHSAALVARGLEDEISRRIWSAEVGVLLPFVEERRQAILDEFSGVLKVPFTTRFGEVIEDLNDLEIGHIDSQLSDLKLTVNYDVRRFVQRLREIRNCLSHVEPLSPEVLLCEEIKAGFWTGKR
jgi:hypothetical protein